MTNIYVYSILHFILCSIEIIQFQDNCQTLKIHGQSRLKQELLDRYQNEYHTNKMTMKLISIYLKGDKIITII